MKKKEIERLRAEEAMEPQYAFDDRTILQSDGHLENCKMIMRKDQVAEPWYIQSNMTLTHMVGMGQFRLQFVSDGTVQIIRFDTTEADENLNRDIALLKVWAIDHGWAWPEPSEGIIRDMPEFWKFMWKYDVINSATLDKRYGKKRHTAEDDIDEEGEIGKS